MAAYYNEFDPEAAQLLRNLIDAGMIAPGDVDERSIEDVNPGDLRGYTQHHFFAGAGVWSYALRLAGWPDEREVWTGSCPCQPFSAAGKGAGFADERHLWPAFFHLIQHGKRPGVPLYGEQVASPDALAWLDVVQADLEAENHTVRTFDLCAAGFGAPIIRQRLFWRAESGGGSVTSGRSLSGLGDSNDEGLEGRGGMFRCGDQLSARPASMVSGRPGPTNGFWGTPDWLLCRDDKWRPVESGTFPLVDGAPSRVGPGGAVETQPRAIKLRVYGNAISAEVAKHFILASIGAMYA